MSQHNKIEIPKGNNLTKNTAVLYSGGKDSTYAIDMLKRSGHIVSCLITIVSQNPDSYMLHTANIQLTELCSRAIGIPLVVGFTDGNKEEELQDISQTILRAKKDYDFEILVSGGLASSYQKTRIEKIAEDCGLTAETPLWGINQEEYIMNLVDSGYRFILTSVSAGGLDSSWLGRETDYNSALELIRLAEKYKFNPALEGGEGETLVLDCPLFKENRLKILESRKIWNGYRGILEINKALLESKKESISCPPPPIQV